MVNTTNVSNPNMPLEEPETPRGDPGRTVSLDGGERAVVAWEAFVSVCGWAGGLYMSTHELTVMPTRYLQGTWFHTWRWPGIALAFFVGLCPALVAAAALLRLRVSKVGHICVGAGLVAWISLEAAWIVVSPGMQLFFGAAAVTILILGLRELSRGPDRAKPKTRFGSGAHCR